MIERILSIFKQKNYQDELLIKTFEAKAQRYKELKAEKIENAKCIMAELNLSKFLMDSLKEINTKVLDGKGELKIIKQTIDKPEWPYISSFLSWNRGFTSIGTVRKGWGESIGYIMSNYFEEGPLYDEPGIIILGGFEPPSRPYFLNLYNLLESEFTKTLNIGKKTNKDIFKKQIENVLVEAFEKSHYEFEWDQSGQS